MGKPYKNEILQIGQTYAWALGHEQVELDQFVAGTIGEPLVAVGSGGSFSAASFAATLHRRTGTVGTATTPYEFIHSGTSYRSCHVLILSAGGRNPDVLSALKYAVELEPKSVGVLSMVAQSKLSALADESDVRYFVGVDIPTGRDGFLATNSLVATATMLATSYGRAGAMESAPHEPELLVSSGVQKAPSHVDAWTVLYGPWGQPAAYDLESKLTEAALGTTQLSDYRNFGHGRHHWFAKRAASSGVILLSTPEDQEMADRTGALLPDVPVVPLQAASEGASGAIELLGSALRFVEAVGENRGIDPGRPGVPPFGRKLYRLSPPRRSVFDGRPKGMTRIEAAAVYRKAGGAHIGSMPETQLAFWRGAYRAFVRGLTGAKFSAVVLDYDGTLCEPSRRFDGVSDPVAEALVRVIESAAALGIATGRGRSVGEDLRRRLPPSLWERVVVGYYNGSDVASLADEDAPDKSAPVHEEIRRLDGLLADATELGALASAELRPNQLTLEAKRPAYRSAIRRALADIVRRSGLEGLKLLESGHSFDVVSPTASKLHVVAACRRIAGHGTAVLCIGDRGEWPGNDHDLLRQPHALSVDTVSPDPSTGWNISPPGRRGVAATMGYLQSLAPGPAGLRWSPSRTRAK